MYTPQRSSYRCLGAFIAVVLICHSSFAQTSDTDWANVRNLEPDRAISIKLKSGAKYHGEFVNATNDFLSIDSSERAFPGRTIRRRELPRADVREVRIVEPAKSLLAGAAIGTAIGAGLGAGLESTAKSKEDNGLLPLSSDCSAF